jgi:tRNA-specific 2-thiouridylase
MGKVVGKHQESALFYNWTTQRLKCGWNNWSLFIIATDVDTNTIYTGLTSQHPGLFKSLIYW